MTLLPRHTPRCEFDASLTCSNACKFSSISSNDVMEIREYLWWPNQQLYLEYDNRHKFFTERYLPFKPKSYIRCQVPIDSLSVLARNTYVLFVDFVHKIFMIMSKDIQELLQVPTTKTVDCILCVGGGVGGGDKGWGEVHESWRLWNASTMLEGCWASPRESSVFKK